MKLNDRAEDETIELMLGVTSKIYLKHNFFLSTIIQPTRLSVVLGHVSC